jgi:hypothetical protein
MVLAWGIAVKAARLPAATPAMQVPLNDDDFPADACRKEQSSFEGSNLYH